MYQHLSHTAEEVLHIAYDLALESSYEYLGTEHILLAIMKHGEGVGAKVLAESAVTWDALEDQIKQLARDTRDKTWVFGRLPGTPHFKQVFAHAIEEAECLGDAKICTEHILLGILHETGCLAEKALRNLGVDFDSIREKIISVKKYNPQ
jgi:ATP-dependent Clp protease ATP-binding subunit ClpC